MDAPVQPADESEQTITIVLPSASYTFARATEQNLTEVRPSQETITIVFPSASYTFARATEHNFTRVRQETGFGQPSELVA